MKLYNISLPLPRQSAWMKNRAWCPLFAHASRSVFFLGHSMWAVYGLRTLLQAGDRNNQVTEVAHAQAVGTRLYFSPTQRAWVRGYAIMRIAVIGNYSFQVHIKA